MNLNSLPPELAHEIITYLPFKDVLSLSLCSKFWREYSVPIIFRAIYISRDTPKAFADGGSLSHIKDVVRHVSFDTSTKKCIQYSSTPAEEIGETIKYYRECSAGLKLFPRLDSLLVLYESLEVKYPKAHLTDFDTKLFHGFFSTISGYTPDHARDPGDSTPPLVTPLIKALHFSYIDNSHSYEYHGLYMKDVFCPYEIMSEDDTQFLDPSVGIDARGQSSHEEASGTQTSESCKCRELEQQSSETISKSIYPSALEEIEIDIMGPGSFSRSHRFNPLLLIQSTSESLRKVVLFCEIDNVERLVDEATLEEPIVFPFPHTVFPNVKELYFGPGLMVPILFRELTLRFPNVESMKVLMADGDLDRVKPDLLGEFYADLLELGKLKDIMVPYQSHYIIPNITGHLRTQVDNWVQDGLPLLEDVLFVLESEYPDHYERNLMEVVSFQIDDTEARDSGETSGAPNWKVLQLVGVTEDDLKSM
ncbi:hypothetical protein H072_9312 [Dactylellina haptotyla CBS 200.50]|uniref:F-box domain-containing protein n=1 Tax=Dactylellina haptotyla (strain CBS 200.50) TaxID=1284197 RepID=S8A2U9_DACHA|nr:hypothetical protein H072_9312 [Dactylellina haptotyla CBS 200.50]